MANHPELQRYYVEGSSDEIVRALIELNKEQAYPVGGLPDAIDRITALTARLKELDPHYLFVLSASPVDGVKIAVIPRYPGAEKDRPIRLNAAFNFPDTDEGRAATAALSDTVAYGTASEIAEEFITSVTVDGIAVLDTVFNTAKLAFGPGQDPNLPIIPSLRLPQDAELLHVPLSVLHEPAVKLATGNLRPGDFHTMTSANERLREAAQRGDAVATRQADEEFHAVLLDRTDNPFLVQVIEWLSVHSRRLNTLYFTRDRPTTNSYQVHPEIIAALRDGDEERARQLARNNILRTIDVVRASSRSPDRTAVMPVAPPLRCS
jgi:hypothetical protein